MTELWLQEGSDEVLTEWWNSDKPREGDRELVAEVVRTLQKGTWRTRWFYTEELADDPSLLPPIAIQPRDNLVVLVRFWPAEDPPEVQLIAIFEIEGSSESDPSGED